jgi:hypothetical protein
MIFCNEHATSVWLSRFLGEHSIKNTLMNAQMTPWVKITLVLIKIILTTGMIMSLSLHYFLYMQINKSNVL